VEQGVGLSPDQGSLGLSRNRIAVRFAYEWHEDSGNWFRSYGNENWEFDEQRLMRRRLASINDLPIKEPWAGPGRDKQYS
jgi:nuclear transport factor 2 (NTF2) superfamily protein